MYKLSIELNKRMNHVPVSFATRSFIIGHVGVVLMAEWSIWDSSVTNGRVNIDECQILYI